MKKKKKGKWGERGKGGVRVCHFAKITAGVIDANLIAFVYIILTR